MSSSFFLLFLLNAVGQTPTFNWVNQIGTIKTDKLIYTAIGSDDSVYTAADYNNGGLILKKFDANGTELFSKLINGAAQPSNLIQVLLGILKILTQVHRLQIRKPLSTVIQCSSLN